MRVSKLHPENRDCSAILPSQIIIKGVMPSELHLAVPADLNELLLRPSSDAKEL